MLAFYYRRIDYRTLGDNHIEELQGELKLLDYSCFVVHRLSDYCSLLNHYILS